ERTERLVRRATSASPSWASARCPRPTLNNSPSASSSGAHYSALRPSTRSPRPACCRLRLALSSNGCRRSKPDRLCADSPCDECCNRAAARLQCRGPILNVVTTDGRKTMSMGTQRRIRHKLFEWLRRYAPNEIAGWVGQAGAAAATYELT